MKTGAVLLAGLIVIAAFAIEWHRETRKPPASVPLVEGQYPYRNSNQDAVDTSAVNEKYPVSAPAAANSSNHEWARDVFERLVANRQFSEAIELYQDVYTRYDESVSNHLRNVLFENSSELARLDPERAAQLLTSYVQVFYRDVDALLKLAKIHEQQQDYQQSLLRLQEAYAAAHTQVDLEHIQSRIDRAIGELAQKLARTKDHNGLASLYRAMIERQPNHAPYYLALAQAHVAADSPQAALTALRYIEYDSQVGSQAREMITRLEGIGRGSISEGKLSAVPLIPSGNHFFVNAKLNGVPVKLMLDTGASITVIKSELAYTAGIPVDHSHTVTLTTANGRAHAPVAHVKQIQLGNQTIPRFKVVVLDLEELTGVDGLLGMDFLGRYRFTIDREQKTLFLNK
jgi:clan AA aspartic protease (TIGR02281 family)